MTDISNIACSQTPVPTNIDSFPISQFDGDESELPMNQISIVDDSYSSIPVSHLQTPQSDIAILTNLICRIETIKANPLVYIDEPKNLQRTFYYDRLQNLTAESAQQIKSELQHLVEIESEPLVYEDDLKKIKSIIEVLDRLILTNHFDVNSYNYLMCTDKIADLADGIGDQMHPDNTFVNYIYDEYIIPVLRPIEDQSLDIYKFNAFWDYLSLTIKNIDQFYFSLDGFESFSVQLELVLTRAMSHENRVIDYATIEVIFKIFNELIAVFNDAGVHTARSQKIKYMLQYIRSFLCDAYNFNNESERKKHSQFNPNYKFYNAPIQVESIFNVKTLHLLASRGSIDGYNSDDILVHAPELVLAFSCISQVFADPLSLTSEEIIRSIESIDAIKIITKAWLQLKEFTHEAIDKQTGALFEMSKQQVDEILDKIEKRLSIRTAEIQSEHTRADWLKLWSPGNQQSFSNNILGLVILPDFGIKTPDEYQSSAISTKIKSEIKSLSEMRTNTISIWHQNSVDKLIDDLFLMQILSGHAGEDELKHMGFEMNGDELHELVLLTTIDLMYGTSMQQVLATDLNLYLFGNQQGDVLFRELPELLNDEADFFANTSEIRATSKMEINETRRSIRTITALADVVLKNNRLDQVKFQQTKMLSETFKYIDALLVRKYASTMR